MRPATAYRDERETGSLDVPHGLQPTIYVVDDDDAVRDSLKMLLESYQLTVRDFGSVPEFLNGLDAVDNSCLVLDLHLPAMGGFDVMKTLARRGIRLPVIVITGGGDAQTRARALEAGAMAFLEKPVDDQALMGAITSALRGDGAAAPGRRTDGLA
jgi:two-component system, LuxR family, response regulator FixJ